jgi:hypothetical protein
VCAPRAADPRAAAAGQAARLLRRPDRPTALHARGGRPGSAARPRGPPGLQDGRHLRRRVRGPDALLLLAPTTRRPRCSPGAAGRHHPRLRAPTGSGRASSSTTPACTPASPCATPATTRSWSTATPRPSPPTTTRAAASTSSRSPSRTSSRSSTPSGRRPDRRGHRPARRPDPLGLAKALKDEGVPIVGTSPEAIHLAEDRGAFGRVLAEANLPAPKHGTAYSAHRGRRHRARDRLPGARASVLRARRARDGDRLRRRDPLGYVDRAAIASPGAPDPRRPLPRRRDRDRRRRLYDGVDMYLGGIMEHIEEAGIHSGDSACTLPPATLGCAEIERVRRSSAGAGRGHRRARV